MVDFESGHAQRKRLSNGVVLTPEEIAELKTDWIAERICHIVEDYDLDDPETSSLILQAAYFLAANQWEKWRRANRLFSNEQVRI